ncbi:hypothetical protein K438DRAFT_1769704 [Mycena galopus ATCC 62051]|nr:hypothetical protein K438DRAFT_1769704 [Mycena galopus ATCC 62051]
MTPHVLPSTNSESATPVIRSKTTKNCMFMSAAAILGTNSRFQKCDTARPKCHQCRLRPPKSLAPCQYPLDITHDRSKATPAEMAETIKSLEERIQKLESLVDSDPSRVYLSVPYRTSAPQNSTHDSIELWDIFLARFAERGYFFLDPVQFRKSALLPLPFGDQNRPSPALLSAVYLWGSVLFDNPLVYPYTPDAFLTVTIGVGSNVILETLQAEILLSLYFMRRADPVQGRYHCVAATSIAYGAGLLSPLQHNPYPTFPTLRTMLLPNPSSSFNEAVGTLVILSNCWVAADGAPSFNIHEPQDAGVTSIQRFLQDAEISGFGTSAALLAKAGLLLGHIISFVHAIPPDLTVFASLERQLLVFRGKLPPLPGDQNLILTHVLADVGILRLHAPYSSIWEDSRLHALHACGRILDGIEGLGALNVHHVDPVLGPIYWTIASFYMSQITSATQSSPESNFPNNVPNPQAELDKLMNSLAWLAPHSPIFAILINLEYNAEHRRHAELQTSILTWLSGETRDYPTVRFQIWLQAI